MNVDKLLKTMSRLSFFSVRTFYTNIFKHISDIVSIRYRVP